MDPCRLASHGHLIGDRLRRIDEAMRRDPETYSRRVNEAVSVAIVRSLDPSKTLNDAPCVPVPYLLISPLALSECEQLQSELRLPEASTTPLTSSVQRRAWPRDCNSQRNVTASPR